MGGKEDFERFEQTRRLPGPFEKIVDLALVPVGHGRDDRLLVFKIAIDEAHTDPGLGTDIVHTGLVEATFGKTDHGRVEDLLAAIGGGLDTVVGHEVATMNERSFIVKWRLM